MGKYILGNKEAWEEAFDLKTKSYGADIEKLVQSEEYSFFNKETTEVLKKYDLKIK